MHVVSMFGEYFSWRIANPQKQRKLSASKMSLYTVRACTSCMTVRHYVGGPNLIIIAVSYADTHTQGRGAPTRESESEEESQSQNIFTLSKTGRQK